MGLAMLVWMARDTGASLFSELPGRHARLRRARDRLPLSNRRQGQITLTRKPEMKRPIVAVLTYAPLFLLAAAPAPASAAQIFVSNEKDNTVTVIDSKTLEQIKTIPVGRRPRGIVIAPDGKEVFVCLGDDDSVAVIDTDKLEVTRHLDSGPDPELMDIDPKGERVYIANEDDSLVTVIDRKSGDVVAEVPVGVEPEGMHLPLKMSEAHSTLSFVLLPCGRGLGPGFVGVSPVMDPCSV